MDDEDMDTDSDRELARSGSDEDDDVRTNIDDNPDETQRKVPRMDRNEE